MDRLQQNQQLNINDQLISNNGRVNLIMQGDGNLVLYRTHFIRALWASNTWQNPVNHVVMQDDGNLVAYSAAGAPYWATGTDGHSGAWVVLQDDGNLVVYDSANNPLWASNTVQNFLMPTIGYDDANGYTYVETSELWKDICSQLPCFIALQWPGYLTKIVEDRINGQDVVIQLWIGWCQKFLGLQDFPGGIGAEVGVYRRIPGKVRPTSLPFLPKQIETDILNGISTLSDNELWWPFPELNAQIEFTLTNPITNQVLFNAGPETSYWLAKWMNEPSYLKYQFDRGLGNTPNFFSATDYLLDYKINGKRYPQWSVGKTSAGSTTSGVVAATTRNTDKLDIFVADKAEIVKTAAWEPVFADGWQGWWPIGNIRVPVGAPIHVVSRNTDKLDIFVTDEAGAIRTAAWEPAFTDGWHGWWEVAAGRAAPGAAVTAVSRGKDKLDVFVVGTDGRVWTAAWEPSFADGWHGWWLVG
jgi:hypothetical protein